MWLAVGVVGALCTCLELAVRVLIMLINVVVIPLVQACWFVMCALITYLEQRTKNAKQ